MYKIVALVIFLGVFVTIDEAKSQYGNSYVSGYQGSSYYHSAGTGYYPGFYPPVAYPVYPRSRGIGVIGGVGVIGGHHGGGIVVGGAAGGIRRPLYY